MKKKDKHHDPQNLREIIYLRAYWDFEFFVRYFLPHHCALSFSSMHLDFFQQESDPTVRGRRELILAPRGHAKTTLKVTAKALHAIAYNTDPFILIVSCAAPEGKQKATDILSELENNARVKAVYGVLAPTRGRYDGKGRWGQSRFVTNNGVCVMAKSQGQQVRGLKYGPSRPSLILCDDIESLASCYSPEQRQKTREWFEKDILKLVETDGSTNVLVVGTCIHPESLLSHLIELPGWKGHRYQALLQPPDNTALWDEYKRLYCDLSDCNRVHTAHAFYLAHQPEMDVGTAVLWPEGDSYEKLLHMQIDEGIGAFQTEKQNDPYDPDKQIFNLEAAVYFDIEYDTSQHPIAIRRADGTVIALKDMVTCYAFHDPALGESRTCDFAAVVVACKDRNGYFYVLDAWVERSSPSSQIQTALALCARWSVQNLYVEENHFQRLLKDQYNQQVGNLLKVFGVNQTANKHRRISLLEPLISRGQLQLASGLSPTFMSQLRLFPTTHDDGPDALEGVVTKLLNFTPIPIAMPINVGGEPSCFR